MRVPKSQAQLARLLPSGLSLLVSLVELKMAAKGLSAKEWLPFHQAAAEADWGSLTPRLRLLLLFMVRMAGPGFLGLFLLLAAPPIYLARNLDPFAGLAIFGIGRPTASGSAS